MIILRKRFIAVLVCILALIGAVTAIVYLGTFESSKVDEILPQDEKAAAMDKSIGAPNIIVPDDYSTITLAVADAENGDVIYVKNGVYLENVTINKPLTLVGESNETTLVDGNNIGTTFLVVSDNVTIANFKVRNGEDPPPTYEDSSRLAGIHLLGAHNCSVFDNVVTGCGKGVWVYGGSDNSVFDNNFIANNYGVLLASTSKNLISSNNASNGWSGIYLNAEGNVLEKNRMNDNAFNLALIGEVACSNEIGANNFVDNKKLYIFNGLSGQTISPESYPDLGALVIANSKDLTVQNLNLTNSYVGVQIFNSENIKIVNATIQNSRFGITVDNCSGCNFSSNTIKKIGSAIILADSKNVIIKQNTFENTQWIGRTAVAMRNSSGCAVEENTFIGKFETGFSVDASNNNKFTNNKSIYKVRFVFWLTESSSNQIESNRFSLCTIGLRLNEESHNNSIVGNHFACDIGSIGLELTSANNNTVSSNAFVDFSCELKLSCGENNVLTKNIITIEGDYAIMLYQFSNNIFDDNYIMGKSAVLDRGLKAGKEASVNTWK